MAIFLVRWPKVALGAQSGISHASDCGPAKNNYNVHYNVAQVIALCQKEEKPCRGL